MTERIRAAARTRCCEPLLSADLSECRMKPNTAVDSRKGSGSELEKLKVWVVRAGIRETQWASHLEAEARVVGWISNQEDRQPAGVSTLRQAGTDELGANPLALATGDHGHRR